MNSSYGPVPPVTDTVAALEEAIWYHVRYSLGKAWQSLSKRDLFVAVAKGNGACQNSTSRGTPIRSGKKLCSMNAKKNSAMNRPGARYSFIPFSFS